MNGFLQQILDKIGPFNRSFIVPFRTLSSDVFTGVDSCVYWCRTLVWKNPDTDCCLKLGGDDSCDCNLYLNVSVWISAGGIRADVWLSGPSLLIMIVGAGKLWSDGDPIDCDGPIVLPNEAQPDAEFPNRCGMGRYFCGGSVEVSQAHGQGSGECIEDCFSCPCNCPVIMCLLFQLVFNGETHTVRARVRKMGPTFWASDYILIDGVVVPQGFYVWLTCTGGSSPRWQISWLDVRTDAEDAVLGALGQGDLFAAATVCPTEVTAWVLGSTTLPDLSVPAVTVGLPGTGGCFTGIGCAELGDHVAINLKHETDQIHFVKDLTRVGLGGDPPLSQWEADEFGWSVGLECDPVTGHFVLSVARGAETWTIESDDGANWTTTGGAHTSAVTVVQIANAIDRGNSCVSCTTSPDVDVTGTPGEGKNISTTLRLNDPTNKTCVYDADDPLDPNTFRLYSAPGQGGWGQPMAEARYLPAPYPGGPPVGYRWRAIWASPTQCFEGVPNWYLVQNEVDASRPALSVAA